MRENCSVNYDYGFLTTKLSNEITGFIVSLIRIRTLSEQYNLSWSSHVESNNRYLCYQFIIIKMTILISTVNII